jgi:dolichol-phosphate mannosyltransferase
MHRFMATLVRYLGGKVVEVDVNHRPRGAGTAKYGIGNRALRGLYDCFAVRWMKRRTMRYRVEREL